MDTSAPVIDFSFAEEVAAGDSAFMEKLLSTFLRNIASLRAELDDAVGVADARRIRSASHGLKGVFQTMGASPAAEAALLVEKAEAAPPVELGPLLERLAVATQHVEVAVRHALSERFSAADRARVG